ncbi:extracellular solute-binding protein [Paenibacillus cymbidii]|uniref:extracellular solute-binding protein n=1 Tax=Paenibacillus cymbidii TaxID=1639034 RepID=UPI0010815FAF|nr:extracellular solute-binding protein [Paenibacillus cymbidii]
MKLFSHKLPLALLVIVLPMAGCRQADQQKNVNPATGDGAISSNAPALYDPPITMTTVMFSYPTTKYFGSDTYADNIWMRTIAEKYGIRVKPLWQASSTEYVKKTNQMIASGEMPDFFAATPQQFKDLLEAGKLEDLTDAYRQYASPSLRKTMQDAGGTVMKSATIDGRLMAIPWTGTNKELAQILWIRKDWKERLQLPDPHTIDDLFAISDAFVKRDPDGNGIADTYGMAMEKGLSMALGMMGGYGAYLNLWLQDGHGKLVFSELSPQMKLALTKLNEMYKAGHFDPEFVVKDPLQAMEKVGSGKIGMLFGTRGTPNSQLVALTPEQEWLPFEVPTADGTPYKAHLPLNIFNYYWVVKKGAPHPEAMLHMMDFYLQTYYFNDSEDVYYRYIVPNKEDQTGIWTYSPVKLLLPDNNIENYRKMMEVLNGKMTREQLAPERKKVYDRIMLYKNGQKNMWSEMAQNGPGGSASIIDRIIKENRFVEDHYYAPPTETMAELGESLTALRNETFNKIIIGTLPPDAFDQFVADWYRLGGRTITDEVNEWYAKNR